MNEIFQGIIAVAVVVAMSGALYMALQKEEAQYQAMSAIERCDDGYECPKITDHQLGGLEAVYEGE